MDHSSLFSFKQFCLKHPAFNESGLRWLRFNSKQNGFSAAFKKVSGRVLIDEQEFFNCIERNNTSTNNGEEK